MDWHTEMDFLLSEKDILTFTFWYIYCRRRYLRSFSSFRKPQQQDFSTCLDYCTRCSSSFFSNQGHKYPMLWKQRLENPDFEVSAMLSSAFLSSQLSTPALSDNLNSASHPWAKYWGWWCFRQSYTSQDQNYQLPTPKQGFDFGTWNHLSLRMQTFMPSPSPVLWTDKSYHN